MEYDIIVCPDCGLFYMPGRNQETKEKVYSFVESDTDHEIYAKKLAENVYQCDDCGSVFELDNKVINSFKSILSRPRGVRLDGLDEKVFKDEFELAFKVEPTKKQLKAFIDYMTGKSKDVSAFIDVVLSAKNELEPAQKQ